MCLPAEDTASEDESSAAAATGLPEADALLGLVVCLFEEEGEKMAQVCMYVCVCVSAGRPEHWHARGVAGRKWSAPCGDHPSERCNKLWVLGAGKVRWVTGTCSGALIGRHCAAFLSADYPCSAMLRESLHRISAQTQRGESQLPRRLGTTSTSSLQTNTGLQSLLRRRSMCLPPWASTWKYFTSISPCALHMHAPCRLASISKCRSQAHSMRAPCTRSTSALHARLPPCTVHSAGRAHTSV